MLLPGIIGALVTIVIILVIYGLLKLLLDRAPNLDGQIKVYLNYLLLVLFVIWAIWVLLAGIGFIAGPPIFLHNVK
jgi:hypothetical protein